MQHATVLQIGWVAPILVWELLAHTFSKHHLASFTANSIQMRLDEAMSNLVGTTKHVAYICHSYMPYCLKITGCCLQAGASALSFSMMALQTRNSLGSRQACRFRSADCPVMHLSLFQLTAHHPSSVFPPSCCHCCNYCLSCCQ